jgi:hypothetical protein
MVPVGSAALAPPVVPAGAPGSASRAVITPSNGERPGGSIPLSPRPVVEERGAPILA